MVVRWNCPGLVEALAAGETPSPGKLMELVHRSVSQPARDDAVVDKPVRLAAL